MPADGAKILEGQGWAHYHLCTVSPAAAGTSTAWIDTGQYGATGALQVTGIATTTALQPEIHGSMLDSTPAIGTAGVLFGSTITANGFYDTDNLPRYIRMFFNANTTTAATVQVWWIGRSGA